MRENAPRRSLSDSGEGGPDARQLSDPARPDVSVSLERISFLSHRKGRIAVVHVRRMAVAVTAMLALLMTLAQSAAAGSQVPFEATMAANFVNLGPSSPAPFCVQITGSGQATHLGRTSEAREGFGDLAGKPAPNCK